MPEIADPDIRLVTQVIRRFRYLWRGPTDWEELRQVGRIALWHAFEGYDPTIPSKMTWPDYARRKIRNAIIDEVRRQIGRNGDRHPSKSRAFVHGDLETRIDPSTPAEQRDEEENLRRAIGELDTRHQFVVKQRLRGWRHRDIADVLGLTEARVWQLWRGAQHELAIRLASPVELEPEVDPEVPKVVPKESVKPLADVEKKAIMDALWATQGSVNLASQLLEIGRATLYRRLTAWGVNPEEFRCE